MADVPVPGPELSDDRFAAAIPAAVLDLLETLWRAGHGAYVVGGALRDVAAGRPVTEWDLATSALPEQTADLFADAVYENRFGTVAVRRAGEEFEITTFRSDHDYADHRRPHRIEFGSSIELDLARRDFTMNALAWGADGGGGAGRTPQPPGLVDRYDGLADIAAGTIRAVGDPRLRFEEDALRILRAIRFATTLGWTIEPATLAAIRETAPLVAHLSGERIWAELKKILEAEWPSTGLRLLQETGALAAISADLAAQHGVAQRKIPGDDLWDHTLRTVDAAPADRPVVRLAALVHDIGKPSTAADGHFFGHDSVGADLAGALLDRLHVPVATRTRVVHLVRQHMFRYEPGWRDPAIRRFLAKVGPGAVDDLLALREADNVGSGVARDADDLAELRSRIAAELAAGPILDRSALAIDGADLIEELGMVPGPEVGQVLAALFDQVVENPAMNDRATLLGVAAELASAESAAAELSVQLYAVRAALADDPDATLGRLAALGFRRVEPYDLLAFRDALREGLPRHGLAAPTAHCEILDGDIEAVFDVAAELGIGTLIQPWVDPARWQTEEGVRGVAEALNVAAARAAERGLRVGYHNHHFELKSQVGGRHALEWFAGLLDPAVALEIDTYWAFAGGADVPALLARLGGRVVALHVKDGDGGLDTATQVAVGSGRLPVREIVAAAPDALRVVELDDTAGDMFEAIRASRDFLLAAPGGAG